MKVPKWRLDTGGDKAFLEVKENEGYIVRVAKIRQAKIKSELEAKIAPSEEPKKPQKQ